MRRLIKTALKKEPRLQVIFEAKHGREAVDNLATAKPDVVVMRPKRFANVRRLYQSSCSVR